MRYLKSSLCITILLFGFLCFDRALPPYFSSTEVRSSEKSRIVDSLPRLSNRFIRIIHSLQDQWMLYTPSGTVFFQPDGVVFMNRLSPQDRIQIRLQWESSDPSKTLMKMRGDRLCYQNIQNGIDVEFYLNSQKNVEYDIVLKKMTSLEKLRFHLSGCEVFCADNRLVWKTPFGNVLEKVLSVHQADFTSVPYKIVMDAPNIYHYQLDFPETAVFPIMIDPEIVFSTYFGEEDEISLESITHDSSGAIYACGTIQLPVISPEDGYVSGPEKTNVDTIFLKIDPNGEQLFQSVIFGGEDGDELPADIKLSVNEAVYVVGTTTSKDYPVSRNAIQPTYQGFGDAFCFVINSQTEEILFSSYWGGSKSDNVTSLAVLPNGNAVLCGTTNSQDFPLKRPAQAFNQGLFDGFLSVIAIDKKQTEFSTFLGGKNQDSIECIAIQKEGGLIVAGTTQSPDFYTAGGKENAYQGGMDIFVTMYTPSYIIAGSNLFGGSNHDFPADMVCNDQTTYLIGTTLSQNFPVTTEQNYHGHGTSDVFEGGDIVLMSLQETLLVQASFFGGSDDDIGVSVAIDEKKQVYFTGNTRSGDLPVTHNALKRVLTDTVDHSEGMDGFIARIDSSLQNITYGSFWGGNGIDLVHDGSLYRNKITMIGSTDSEDFYTTLSSFKGVKTRNTESFLSSISIGYYPPSAPEDLRIIEEENEVLLRWSPSQPGEAPIQGYGILFKEYHIQGRGLVRAEERTLIGTEIVEFPLSGIGMEEDKNYYFAVYAFDQNNQVSQKSVEASIIHQKNELSPFLLAEFYDNSITTESFDPILQYFTSLENPALKVLHYYPALHPSRAIQSRARWYNVCRKSWCLVNGSLSLTMQDQLEDTIRLMTTPIRKPSHTIQWQKLSVPNEEDNKEVKITLKKTNPYPRSILLSTVFLARQITGNHFEVITSVKSLWNIPHVLFGEEVVHFTFYYQDIPEIQSITDPKEYYLVVLLQDPMDRELVANSFIPLAENVKEETTP